MSPSSLRRVGYTIALVSLAVTALGVVFAPIGSRWAWAIPAGVVCALAGAALTLIADARDPGLDR